MTKIYYLMVALLILLPRSFALTPNQTADLLNFSAAYNLSDTLFIAPFNDTDNSLLLTQKNFTNFYNASYIDSNFFNKTLILDNISQIYYQLERVNNSVNLEILRLLGNYTSQASSNATESAKNYINNLTKTFNDHYLSKTDFDTKILNTTVAIKNQQIDDDYNQTLYLQQYTDSKASGNFTSLLIFLLIFSALGNGFLYWTFNKRIAGNEYLRKKDSLDKEEFVQIKKRIYGADSFKLNEPLKNELAEKRRIKQYVLNKKIAPEVKKEILDKLRGNTLFNEKDIDDEIAVIEGEKQIERDKNRPYNSKGNRLGKNRDR